jgi:hypothetical protein
MDSYLLNMVLDDSNRLNEVLEAWRTAGIRGTTNLERTGLNRVLPRHTAQPMFAGFSQMFGGGRVGHQTLFAIIDSLELAEAAVSATEAVIGKLTDPNTGIMFVTPVLQVWGLPKKE